MKIPTRHMPHLSKANKPPSLSITTNHPLLSQLECCPPSHFTQIHAQFIVSGLSRSVFAASRLLKFSATALNPHLTNLIFSQIQNPDLYSYNLSIKSLSKTLHPHPLSTFTTLLRQNLRPNEYTFCFLLGCSLSLSQCTQLHTHLTKLAFDLTPFSATSLVHMYGELGLVEQSLQSFDQIPHRTPASWAAVINACVDSRDPIRALRLFSEMRGLGLEPNNAALVGAVHACAELGDVATIGRAIHGFVATGGFELNVTLGTSLVDMYSKSGAAETAMEVFRAMPVKGVASWSCLINGLALNGCGERAVALFEEMRVEHGLRPNSTTFVGLLQACSHGGMVEEGVRYFSEMESVYGVEPSVKHYGCLIDLYGRAGRIEEAMEVVKAMPMKPDQVVWGALFGACRVHGFAEMGELVAAQIIKVSPRDTCGYLLLCDAFAMRRKWDGVVGVRTMMREMDMAKVPGFSYIPN